MQRSSEGPSSREKILDVAEELFARRGFHAVGIREVADAVGLGKSTLFHHFSSKAQLRRAVLTRALERIEQRLEPALGAGGGLPDRLDACVDALIEALVEHPATARLLLRSLLEEKDPTEPSLPEAGGAQEILAEMLEGVRALLREGVESGVFRPVSVPDTLQTLIGATVFHFASGDFGASLITGPLLSTEAVRRRKREVKEFLRWGLLLERPASRPAPDREPPA